MNIDINKTKTDSFNSKKIILICDNCGKTILAYKSTIRKNAKYHYCSTLCKYEH